MARFLLTNDIQKLPSNHNYDITILWPFGTAFVHIPSGICFRFMNNSTRWGGPSFALGTTRGLLLTPGSGVKHDRYTICFHEDKNILVKRMIAAWESKDPNLFAIKSYRVDAWEDNKPPSRI
jgi:hypothetical protein